MADTYTSTSTLKIETIFTDADTRTFNIPNPKSDLATSDIEALNDFLEDNNLLIGDKTGAQFGRITKATKINSRKTVLDIS